MSRMRRAPTWAFRSWAEVVRAQAGQPGPDAHARSTDLAAIARTKVVDPARGWRGTAAEAARLVEPIRTDRAGPPEACARVRWLISHQSRSRIAAALPDGTRAWGTSGSLFGIWRNEAGVMEPPDGGRFVIAIFTRTHVPFARGRDIEAAIGEGCRLAIV
jgi:beta-lactamase class A